MLNTQVVSSTEEMDTSLSPENWESMELIAWWFMLSIAPGLTWLPQTFTFISLSLDVDIKHYFSVNRTHLHEKGHMYFVKIFKVNMS